MKAILVSVKYDDYLSLALKYNQHIFEEIIVVTIKTDHDTIVACDRVDNVHCICVDDNEVTKGGAVFNKGHLLNFAVKHLEDQQYKGWICSTDGDIIFSSGFDKKFQEIREQVDTYGVDSDRIMFTAPRYFMPQNVEWIESFMNKPDVTSTRDEYGKYTGIKYKELTRLSNEGKERIGLGYCQMYYIDTIARIKTHQAAENPYYYQASDLKSTMGLDTKLIGNFKNSATRKTPPTKKLLDASNVMDQSGKGAVKRGFNIEITFHHEHVYCCHYESDDFYCLHIGGSGTNQKGRVTARIA